MPNVKVLNMSGQQVGEVTLSDAVFGVEPNESVRSEERRVGKECL